MLDSIKRFFTKTKPEEVPEDLEYLNSAVFRPFIIVTFFDMKNPPREYMAFFNEPVTTEFGDLVYVGKTGSFHVIKLDTETHVFSEEITGDNKMSINSMLKFTVTTPTF